VNYSAAALRFSGGLHPRVLFPSGRAPGSIRRVVAASIFALLFPGPLAFADGVRILQTDRDAAEARVEVVIGAESEILASAFVFGNDPLTLTGLSMLRDATRRGVEVRLIVDALWNKVPAPVLAHLQAEGVEIREFHPFQITRPLRLLRRLHDKLLIVDGTTLVAGGRNIQSTYFGFGHQIAAKNYVDTDLLVRGGAAEEARRYFVALWESDEVRPLRRSAGAGELEAASAELDRHKAWLDARIDEARNDRERVGLQLIDAGEVRFLHDPITGGGATRKVGIELGDLLESARESVVIESPYLVPTPALRRGMKRALERGVSIRILTNSLGSTDNILPQAGYAGEKAVLVRSGVELWEYQGPEVLHSKVAVIDGEVAIVGSYNLDPRSQNLNREVAVVVSDPDVAAALRELMDAHLENSRRIDARGYPEGSEEPYPGVSRSKVRKLRLLQIVAPLIRGQL
jgi:cardiolipin synthase C